MRDQESRQEKAPKNVSALRGAKTKQGNATVGMFPPDVNALRARSARRAWPTWLGWVWLKGDLCRR